MGWRGLLVSIVLTGLLAQPALAHPRLDPGRPGAIGYLFCVDGQEGNIHLYLCAQTMGEIPSSRVIQAVLTGLTILYKLDEVFEIDVLILPPKSFMKNDMRGIYNLQTGNIFIRGAEPDDYRLGYVMAHEIAHAIIDQVLKVHGSEHHQRLVCDNELAPIKAHLDHLAGQALVYDHPVLIEKLCNDEGW